MLPNGATTDKNDASTRCMSELYLLVEVQEKQNESVEFQNQSFHLYSQFFFIYFISASISGVPRSSSRNELPLSIENVRSDISYAEGCDLTSSSSSRSSFASHLEVSGRGRNINKSGSVPSACSIYIAEAEIELRETTRSLAEVARVADVYRRPLLDILVSYYEKFFAALLNIPNKIAELSKKETSDYVKSTLSTLVLLKFPSRRLRYYIGIFRRLAVLYENEHPDSSDCNGRYIRNLKYENNFLFCTFYF